MNVSKRLIITASVIFFIILVYSLLLKYVADIGLYSVVDLIPTPNKYTCELLKGRWVEKCGSIPELPAESCCYRHGNW